MSKPVTHYSDEDWDALCKRGRTGDQMWAFADDQITCPACRARLGLGQQGGNCD